MDIAIIDVTSFYLAGIPSLFYGVWGASEFPDSLIRGKRHHQGFKQLSHNILGDEPA